jgi:DNA gyrase subunit A
MGRAAGGVTGIRLGRKGDKVVGTVILNKENKEVDLFTVSEYGYGKKTPTEEYKVQNRAGTGILTYKVTDKTGNLVAAKALYKKTTNDILIASSDGKVLRLSASQVPSLGRATQGVRLMKLDNKDMVTSVALLEKETENGE